MQVDRRTGRDCARVVVDGRLRPAKRPVVAQESLDTALRRFVWRQSGNVVYVQEHGSVDGTVSHAFKQWSEDFSARRERETGDENAAPSLAEQLSEHDGGVSRGAHL